MLLNVPFEKNIETQGLEFERLKTFYNFADEIEAQYKLEDAPGRNSFKASTGYLEDKDNTAFAEELLNSPVVILIDEKRRVPINIERDSFKVWHDEEFMHYVEFEFKIGHDARNYDKW